MSFLVVDEETDRYYIRKGVEITAAMLAAAKVADVVEGCLHNIKVLLNSLDPVLYSPGFWGVFI